MPRRSQAERWSNVLLWLLRQRRLYRVVGESMLPGLKSGDLVFVNFKAYRHSPPAIGHVVILAHPYRPNLRIIKRVTEICDRGKYFVSGDNPSASTDSRSFGPVSGEAILGRVV